MRALAQFARDAVLLAQLARISEDDDASLADTSLPRGQSAGTAAVWCARSLHVGPITHFADYGLCALTWG